MKIAHTKDLIMQEIHLSTNDTVDRNNEQAPAFEGNGLICLVHNFPIVYIEKLKLTSDHISLYEKTRVNFFID